MKYPAFFILLLLGGLVRVPTKVCFAQDQQSVGPRKVIKQVAAMYPQMARSMNLIGTVKLEVRVQANGSVKLIQVKGGSPLLAESAQSAVRSWKWEKADRETTELIEFHFKP